MRKRSQPPFGARPQQAVETVVEEVVEAVVEEVPAEEPAPKKKSKKFSLSPEGDAAIAEEEATLAPEEDSAI